MKEMRFGKSRFSKFMKSNGVFLGLAVALVAIGGVVLLGVDRGDTEQEPTVPDRPVEQVVTDQPDDRTTTSSVEVTTTATTTEKVTEEAPDLYVLPLTNTVQRVFSLTAPLYSVTMDDWRIHSGVDFAGEPDQVVKAAAKGTVVSVEDSEMWGTVIIIDHGVGVQTKYCGVNPSVQVEDVVDASTPIGKLASVPCEAVQPAHLHFEMLVDGVPIDPVEAIGLEVRYADTTDE